MNKKINIAIDGPAASGKSTTARLVAEKLGYIYIDTGAMYRAVTLAVLRAGVDVNDRIKVQQVADQSEIRLEQSPNGQVTYLNGEDVSGEIRLPEITQVISIISAYPRLRQVMVAKQRAIAENGGVVMDGRDIGTVVLPDAELKIFMDASVEERARRRFKELEARKIDVDLEAIKKEIEERDRLDSSRDASPLKPADDAIVIDTSNKSIDEQVQEVLKFIQT